MKHILRSLRNFLLPPKVKFADGDRLEKAENYVERYREIVMDPLNILVNRVPNAGYIDQDGEKDVLKKMLEEACYRVLWSDSTVHDLFFCKS